MAFRVFVLCIIPSLVVGWQWQRQLCKRLPRDGIVCDIIEMCINKTKETKIIKCRSRPQLTHM